MKRSCNTEWDHHNNLIWGAELGSELSHKSLQGYIQTPHLTESTLQARVSHRIVMYPENRSLFSTCSRVLFWFCLYFLIFCCDSSVSKLSYKKNTGIIFFHDPLPFSHLSAPTNDAPALTQGPHKIIIFSGSLNPLSLMLPLVKHTRIIIQWPADHPRVSEKVVSASSWGYCLLSILEEQM